MIPDDESVRRAMQSIEPAGSDVPDLFDRVAVGARRRRRQRSIGAVIAAAVVVAAVALVPALGRNNSSANTQPAGPGLVASSSPSISPLLNGNEHPSSPASPSAMASPLVVVSPRPPLSSTPPPPPLITVGACAGLKVAMTFGDGPDASGIDNLDLATGELDPEPSLNLLTLRSGARVSFEASGPAACVNRVAVSADSGSFPTATASPQPGESGALPLIVRPDGPGVEHVAVLLRPCAAAPKCDGGQLLATTVIAVDPPATSTAKPVSSNLGACPSVLPLKPGADAFAQADAAAVKAVPTIYPPEPTKDFTVTAVYPAGQSLNGGKGIGTIVYSTCGQTIGDRTWVVEVHFPHDPNNSASTGNGQLFVSDFANGGWQVWLRNH
jgi:hypothetical protein